MTTNSSTMNPERRAFVTGLAGAAAAATVAPAALAMTPVDPIFAAIGAHRAATAGVYAIIEAQITPREKEIERL